MNDENKSLRPNTSSTDKLDRIEKFKKEKKHEFNGGSRCYTTPI